MAFSPFMFFRIARQIVIVEVYRIGKERYSHIWGLDCGCVAVAGC